MKYLVHWRMRSLSQEEMRKILPEEIKYFEKIKKEGKLLLACALIGKSEGYELYDADSHEWLYELVANSPFGPYIDLDIWPVVDSDFSLKTMKVILEKKKF
jgi:muconolactone delta-isomerase